MADMYVRNMRGPNRSKRNKGRNFFVLVIILAVLGGAYWLLFLSGEKRVETVEQPADPKPSLPPAPALPPQTQNTQTPVAQPEVATPIAPANPVVQPQNPVVQPAVTSSVINQAKALQKDGEFLKARDLLVNFLKSSPSKDLAYQAKEIIGECNMKLAVSTRKAPEKGLYTVQPGDSFWKISKNVKNTTEFLQRANNIAPNALRPGQQISYISGDFTIDVDLSDFTLTLLRNGEFYRQYKVGLGREDRTPPGVYKIGPKIMNPDWDRRSKGEGIIPYGDPRNQLGVCWMTLVPVDAGLPTDLGIHGTSNPNTVGTNESAGCVRMRNYEVMELYAFILPGITVTIRD